MATRSTWRFSHRAAGLLALSALVLSAACGPKQPPVARPQPPPAVDPGAGTAPARPPAPPEPIRDAPPVTVPAEPSLEEARLDTRSLDELNKEAPLKPLFFALDSAEVDPEGRVVLDANGVLLGRYPSWVVTIEGHCDERGTAEYNLALGERRALAVKNYLVSAGIAADRLRTVSYGKEFPFDPGTSEEAYARNRRAHFVITAR
jgi:peptidoglycan-associated lipoprotein